MPKKPMPIHSNKREAMLDRVRYAGYHGDMTKATGLLIDGAGIFSTAAWRVAYRQGQDRKADGMRCNCPECSPKSEAPGEA
jgi:hypothetical protein